MPWGPEDWNALLSEEESETLRTSAPIEALEEILFKIPGREDKTVADLGCGFGDRLPFLAAHFKQVIAVDYAAGILSRAQRECSGLDIDFQRRDLRDLRPFKGQLDVAVAVDSILGPRPGDVDRVLQQVHSSLQEGGILLATFPAASPGSRPIELRLGEDNGDLVHMFHEVELQYRLARAGFQGVRVRRFNGLEDRPETLLSVAVRRACN